MAVLPRDDKCTWCGDSFNSPHPLEYIRAKNPDALLPRRSARSQECTICNDYLMEEFPEETINKFERAKFKPRLMQDPTVAEKYREGRTRCLAKKNTRGFGWPSKDRVTPKRSGRKRTKKQVIGRKRNNTIDRTTHGVFWPQTIYESKK